MFKKMRHLFAAMAVVALAGCATPVLDAQLKASLRTVQLEATTLPELPMVAMPGLGMAADLSPGGGTVVSVPVTGRGTFRIDDGGGKALGALRFQ